MWPTQSWCHQFPPLVGIAYLVSSFSSVQADPNLRSWAIKSSISETSADVVSDQHVESIDASITGHSGRGAISDVFKHPSHVMTQAMTSEHEVHRRNAEDGVDDEEVVVVVGEKEGDDDDDPSGGANGDGTGDSEGTGSTGGTGGTGGVSESTSDVPLEENTQQALENRYNDTLEERDSLGDGIFLPVSTNNIFGQGPPDTTENRTSTLEMEETPSHHHQGV